MEVMNSSSPPNPTCCVLIKAENRLGLFIGLEDSRHTRIQRDRGYRPIPDSPVRYPHRRRGTPREGFSSCYRLGQTGVVKTPTDRLNCWQPEDHEGTPHAGCRRNGWHPTQTRLHGRPPGGLKAPLVPIDRSGLPMMEGTVLGPTDCARATGETCRARNTVAADTRRVIFIWKEVLVLAKEPDIRRPRPSPNEV